MAAITRPFIYLTRLWYTKAVDHEVAAWHTRASITKTWALIATYLSKATSTSLLLLTTQPPLATMFQESHGFDIGHGEFTHVAGDYHREAAHRPPYPH